MLHVIGSNLIASPEGPNSLLVVKGYISNITEAQIARELDEASLEPHQKKQTSEIFDVFPAELAVLQYTQKNFGVLVLFFHMH